MASNKRGKRQQNTRAVVRTEVRAKGTPAERVERAAVRLRAGECDCRALSAFHAWRDVPMPPSFNVGVDFSQAYGIPPAGKRAVIEQVTRPSLFRKGSSPACGCSPAWASTLPTWTSS